MSREFSSPSQGRVILGGHTKERLESNESSRIGVRSILDAQLLIRDDAEVQRPCLVRRGQSVGILVAAAKSGQVHSPVVAGCFSWLVSGSNACGS